MADLHDAISGIAVQKYVEYVCNYKLQYYTLKYKYDWIYILIKCVHYMYMFFSKY